MRLGGIPDGLRAGPPAALQLARGPLRDVSALIGTVTSELRAISAATESMEKHTRPIGDLHARLETIEARVTSIDSEVAGIRRGVDALQVEVEHVRGHVAPLGRLAGRLGRGGQGSTGGPR